MFPELDRNKDIFWQKRCFKKAKKKTSFCKFGLYMSRRENKKDINLELYDTKDEKELISICASIGCLTPVYQTGLDIEDFSSTYARRQKYGGILHYPEDDSEY